MFVFKEKSKILLYFKWLGADRQKLKAANESVVDAKHLVCVAEIYPSFWAEDLEVVKVWLKSGFCM